MGMLSKDQLKEMIQHYDTKTTENIKDAFKNMFGETIQEILGKIVKLVPQYLIKK